MSNWKKSNRTNNQNWRASFCGSCWWSRQLFSVLMLKTLRLPTVGNNPLGKHIPSWNRKPQWSFKGLLQMAPCLRFAVRVADFYQRHVSKLKRCVYPKESRDSSLLKSSATCTICTTRTVSVLWARSLFTCRNVNRFGAGLVECSFIHDYFHALNTWEQDGAISSIPRPQLPYMESRGQISILHDRYNFCTIHVPSSCSLLVARAEHSDKLLDWAEKWPDRSTTVNGWSWMPCGKAI